MEAVFASYLIRFKPIQSRHARILQYWLRSDAYWQLVRGQATGTTRVSLNAKVLSRFPEERYGDHAGFVAAVRRAADESVGRRRRLLLPEDAEVLVRMAEESDVLK